MSDDAASTLKPVELWDEEDVLALPVGEFDWLDFKASAWLASTTWQDDLSAYLSAWANYGGGFLVIGVKDPSVGGNIEIDGGVDPNLRPKFLESLDQVIPRLVEPPLSKFRTHAIPAKLPDSKLAPGRVIIALHVPESDAAPHQARNHKYYIRRGRHLNPLRHREITDIAGRLRFPKIKTSLSLHLRGGMPKTLFWRVENLSPVMARYVKAVIEFPTVFKTYMIGFEESHDLIGDSNDHRSYWKIIVQNAFGGPLFGCGGTLSKEFPARPITRIDQIRPSITNAKVTTFADHMPPVVEEFSMEDMLGE